MATPESDAPHKMKHSPLLQQPAPRLLQTSLHQRCLSLMSCCCHCCSVAWLQSLKSVDTGLHKPPLLPATFPSPRTEASPPTSGVQPPANFVLRGLSRPVSVCVPSLGKVILQCEGEALASTSPSKIFLNFGPCRPRRRLHLRLEVLDKAIFALRLTHPWAGRLQKAVLRPHLRHHLGKKG